MNAQNQLNLLIQSEFNPAGFVQATRALATFAKELANVNKGMQGLGKEAGKVGAGIGQQTNQIRQLGTGYSNYLSQIQKATEATRAFNGMAGGSGYSNFLSNINQINSGLNSMAGGMQNVSSKGTGAMSAIGNGIRTVGGYMSSLISHTISVGDIFGYYIGMVALQAIYDFTIGMSRLKEDAISVFRFVGMGAEELGTTIDSVTKQTVAMPRVSIPDMLDAYKKIRMSVSMTGEQMQRFAPTMGDIITLFKENGRTGRDAAMAIEDIASGGANAARRLQEIGINSKILKKFGYDINEDAGNVEKLFNAFQALFSDRGMGGISMKLNTVSDAWDYLIELIGYAGMKIGDDFLPYIRDTLLAIANLVNIAPGWSLAIIFGVAGISAAIMVMLPLLAAVITSFGTIGVALNPVSSRIRSFFFEMRGYIALTTAELQAMEKEIKDVGSPKNSPKDFGYKYNKNMAGEKTYFKPDPGAATGWDALTKKIDGAKDSLEGFDASSKKSMRSMVSGQKSATGFGASLKGLGSGIKGVILSLAGLARATLMFMLTNPIGWILLIVSAIITAITVTDRWGEVWALFGDAWNAISGAVMGALNKFVDGIIIVLKFLKETVSKALEWAGIKYVNDDLILFGKKWSDIAADIKAAAYGSATLVEGKPKPEEGQTTGKLSIEGEPGATTSTVQSYINIYNAIIDIQTAWNNWTQSTEGKRMLTELSNAMKAVADAWQDLKNEAYAAWSNIQPMINDLSGAFNDLFVTMQDAGLVTKDTGDKTQDAGGKLSIFGFIVAVVVAALKFLVGVIKLLSPAIQFVIYFIGGLVWIFTQLVRLVNIGKQAFIDAGRSLSALTAIPGLGMLTYMYVMLRKLVCIIIGCSPGLIPAIQWLMSLVTSAFPYIAGVIGSNILGALGYISTFINNTVGWFTQLPGRIQGAIASVPGIIAGIINQAFQSARSAVDQFWSLGQMVKDKIVNSIKSAFGISSPSKVMAGVGGDIGAGITVGINKWVENNVGSIADKLKKDLFGGLEGLIRLFSNWDYRYYWNSMQSIGTSIATLSGNCWDAAVAFIAMANAMGIPASMYETSVHGIDHEIVSLGNGMWVDPSGVMGTGLHFGLPGGFSKSGIGGLGAMAGGAPQVTVYQQNTVREEADINKVTRETARRTADALRFG